MSDQARPKPEPGLDRRTLIVAGTLGITSLGAGTGSARAAQAGPGASDAPAIQPRPQPSTQLPVTAVLAKFIAEFDAASLPPKVRHEGRRTLLNWVGVAVGGSRHEAVDIAVRTLAPLGRSEAGLFGRNERIGMRDAAFVNGVSGHVLDFDDTHLKTIIHPAGPVASAIFAYAEHSAAQGNPISGKDALTALVIGIEVECRIGNAVYPDHYDVGWHITGTAGVFGSAAALARLMQLDAQRTRYALGLAASQPVGLRESFGTMNKSFNPGRAAANGLFAALLAREGFTSSDAMIEAKRGWAAAISRKFDLREITEGLGTRFEAALNTYKPFACGIVLHPIIDGAIQLREANPLTPANIRGVRLQVNPLVLELTGKIAPRSGLEGKFSVYHATAVALITGGAGESAFTDAMVKNPVIRTLASQIRVASDPAIKPEQARLSLDLTDGRQLTLTIEHAVGSVERPMPDAAIEAKFSDLARDILPPDRVRQTSADCWGVDNLSDITTIVRDCAT